MDKYAVGASIDSYWTLEKVGRSPGTALQKVVTTT